MKVTLDVPKLRGVVHLVMSPISLVTGIVLITLASEFAGRITLGVFTLTAVTLFTCSALYHRVGWSKKYKAVWRRIDHANIPILIAGTYTPFAIFLLESRSATLLLSAVWGGAIATAILRVAWVTAPRWLYVIAYIALGWAAIAYLPEFLNEGGVLIFALVLLGGILYSVGALIYATKKPNISPRWFGFHELFHSFTAGAFLAHLTAAILVVFAH
ncbi:MAG: DNA-binding protein [Actinobacteria bacterium]|nr:DNA-binding protein [Actinomycetota bacterium]